MAIKFGNLRRSFPISRRNDGPITLLAARQTARLLRLIVAPAQKLPSPKTQSSHISKLLPRPVSVQNLRFFVARSNARRASPLVSMFSASPVNASSAPISPLASTSRRKVSNSVNNSLRLFNRDRSSSSTHLQAFQPLVCGHECPMLSSNPKWLLRLGDLLVVSFKLREFWQGPVASLNHSTYIRSK